jgi:alpha-1,6-mannosyltransferase
VVHSDFLEAYARPVLRALVGRRGAEVALRGPWSLFARGASRFDLTVVAGPWLAEKLRRHGVPRVACVPFGIDHARFSPAHRSEQLRAELLGPLARDPAARLVVLAGRLAVEKRAALALKALARVHREIPVSVLMLGDGPERPRLEALAARLGLCAQFTGFLKDRERYARCLASADVLVHACAVETFGFVVAEALASGTPVVVPDAGGAADFVDDACAERFDHDGGEVAAAVAIVRLLRRPPGPLRESAVRAGARVPAAASHFDALFALYARCLRDGVAKALEDA